MIGSSVPCAISTGSPSRPTGSTSQPATVGTKPDSARTPPVGAGRAHADGVAHHAPCEKPPITMRS